MAYHVAIRASGATTTLTVDNWSTVVGATVWVKVAGAWVQATGVAVKVGGVWVDAERIQVKVGGTWI